MVGVGEGGVPPRQLMARAWSAIAASLRSVSCCVKGSAPAATLDAVSRLDNQRCTCSGRRPLSAASLPISSSDAFATRLDGSPSSLACSRSD